MVHFGHLIRIDY